MVVPKHQGREHYQLRMKSQLNLEHMNTKANAFPARFSTKA